MNDFTKAALDFMSKNWIELLEGASGAEMIGVNRATLRTRIKKGQALAIRDEEDRERANVEYAPVHLVYNLLYDSLARFGVLPGNKDIEAEQEAMFNYVDYIRDHVVNGEQNVAAVIRATNRDGSVHLSWFKDASDFEAVTGEPVVIVPVGTMVVRLAAKLMAKHDTEMMQKAVGV